MKFQRMSICRAGYALKVSQIKLSRQTPLHVYATLRQTRKIMMHKESYLKLTTLFSFIFFFSGFAALMYQVSWQRLLTVHYGVGTVSITLIVSVYMFGMGIGSLFGGFLAERINNKIFLYFIVELLIGFFGLISLSFLDFLGRYTAGSSYILSFFYMFLFLSLPTLLMGITLPLLTKIFNNLLRDFLKTVSILYFLNTLGAAVGAVFASYAVISFFGLDTAVYVAVIINFLLAVLIFLAKYYPEVDPVHETGHELLPGNRESIFGNVAYLLVFVTGFLAIGYEIAWFRVIGILVKASPYAFSSILSVYLLGIAVGSLLMGRCLERHKIMNRKNIFFLIQVSIGIYVIFIFAGYYYLTKYTPLEIFTRVSFSNILHPRFLMPSFESLSSFLRGMYAIFDVFLWPAVFVFIPTVLMGASFPLISLLALSQRNKEGKTVGTVYFFNITGNVLGGIATGFLLLPYLGTEITLLVFSLTGIMFGIFVSGPPVVKTAIVLVAAAASIILFPGRGRLYETMHTSPGKGFEKYFEEGVDGIIMTYKKDETVKNYINGRAHGGRPGYWFYYEAIEAAAFAPKMENILLIGYGTGSIAEAILKVDEVRKVTLVELNRTLIRNLEKIPLFSEMLSDEKIDLIIDDGRRFLLRTAQKYDLILIDPLLTTTSYSNNLYSRQFFLLARKHLNRGGIFMVYTEEHRVMPKTVLSVFKQVRMYDFFLLASDMPFRRNTERSEKLTARFSPGVRAKLAEKYGPDTFVGDQDHIRKISASYPVNQDWKPVCEYYLGLQVRNALRGKKLSLR